jgi:undecaprenyl-diphosphatase
MRRPSWIGPESPFFTEALALGALQGPTELVPVSSSGHLALLPWLLDWEWAEMDEELRKAFAVALHGASALALLIGSRRELEGTPIKRTVVLLALSSGPAAVAGLVFERPIEQRLGGPGTVAAGLLGGGLALAFSDRAPQARSLRDAGPGDALWLGVAQAAALFPGVSRGGATLAAARLRGFKPADAQRLQRQLALPVIAGAALLKGWRLRMRRLPEDAKAIFLAGAAASFTSTLASRPLLQIAGAERSLLPYAAYRAALAAAVFARLRAQRSEGERKSAQKVTCTGLT